jgi:branched-chain amino acid transport system permease protein
MGFMSAIPVIGDMRVGHKFYYLALVLSALGVAALYKISRSPFGRILNAIRDNAERAQFIGIDVRRYQLIAFTIAGGFAGLAGALFGIYKRGVFPDYAYWSKSAEVLIMTILGGIHHFWGPTVGSAVLILLNGVVVSYTEYWPFVLGVILLALLFGLPGGILGGLESLWRRMRAKGDA